MTAPPNNPVAGPTAQHQVAALPVAAGGGAAGTALDDTEVDLAGREDAPAEDVPDSGVLPDEELPDSGRPGHLRVAPELERGLLHRRRRAQLLVLGVAAISAASMFLLVAFHVFAAQSAFSLDKLDSQLVREQREYGHLRDKVATLSSPDAVASGAKSLGMIRASEVTLLHPPAAPAFGSTGSLPVPPLTPYQAIDDTGQ